MATAAVAREPPEPAAAPPRSAAVSEEADDADDIARHTNRTESGRLAAQQGDRCRALGQVQHSGKMLRTLPPGLQDDMEIVHAAVSNSADALQFASVRLQEDRGLCLLAISKDPSIIEEPWFSAAMKSDKSFGVAAGGIRQFRSNRTLEHDISASEASESDEQSEQKAPLSKHMSFGAQWMRSRALSMRGDGVSPRASRRVPPRPSRRDPQLEPAVEHIPSSAFAASTQSTRDAARKLRSRASDLALLQRGTAEEMAGLPGVEDMPDGPHLEYTLDPPSGHLAFSNSSTPVPFENDHCRGAFLFAHRPTQDPNLESTGKYPCSHLFAGKRRLWELRVRLEFKQRPSGNLWFGIELEDWVDVQMTAKKVVGAAAQMVQKLSGSNGVSYHTLGDDPRKYWGELERPVCVVQMQAADQVVVTPAGEAPPALEGEELQAMGLRRQGDGRTRGFANEVASLQLEVGPTYTLCFWSCSGLVDALSWELRLSAGTRVDLDQFCGGPPVHFVAYMLQRQRPSDEGCGEEHAKDYMWSLTGESEKHAQAWKTYLLRVACWSSERRPSRKRLEELLGLRALTDRFPQRSPRRTPLCNLESFLDMSNLKDSGARTSPRREQSPRSDQGRRGDPPSDDAGAVSEMVRIKTTPYHASARLGHKFGGAVMRPPKPKTPMKVKTAPGKLADMQ